MNILLLTTHLDYGGISSYTLTLAKALQKRKHRVIIASSGGDMLNQLDGSGVEHVHLPLRTKSEINPVLAVCARRLRHFLKKNPVDVVHAQTRVAQVLAHALSRRAKIPYVTTAHGFFRRGIGRQLCPCWGKKVIAISEAVKKHLLLDFFVPAGQITLIPNGIEVGRFAIAPRRLDANHQDRAVGIIARLSPVKGHRVLIEAMEKVAADFPDARLFIFGEGKIKYELIRLAESLGLQEKVFFLPSVADTSDVLSQIDIFVMPSLQEGLGLSILEAQAGAIPVIASNVGGIPSVVRHEVTGLLVPPKDPAALAAAIMKLMQNRKLSMNLSLQGRRSAEENFDIAKQVEAVEQLYVSVTEK